MAKIKDQMLEDQAFREKELEATEPKSGYNFDEKLHLHTLDGHPLTGTSSVMEVVSKAKPLMWWAAGLALKPFGWLNSKYHSQKERVTSAYDAFDKITRMSLDDYEQFLQDCYCAHATFTKEAAQKGTDLHAELERYVKNTMENRMDTYDTKIQPFIKWAVKNVKRFLWSEMHTFSPEHWLGGISDCGAELNNGEIVVIDFKSSKEAYQSHAWQIAGYDIQITENGGYDSRGRKIFTLEKPITQHIVVPFGAKIVKPVVFSNIDGNKRAFLGALAIYRETIRK